MAFTTVAQAHADEEIAKYMTANASSLIGRLPTETLADIFIHCASDYYSKEKGHTTSKPPTWVNVSYVCRHWRNTVLNYPNLWTYLFITSPRWTKELLARSKQASLKVHVSSRVTSRLELNFMEQVMEHIERVEEIVLHLRIMGGIEKFFQNSSCAPRLRILDIETPYRLSRSERWRVFFDGDTPALRTLKLIPCLVPWYSFRLSGLTTLSLRNVPDQLQQNMGEFLTTLCSMRDLKCLYLDRAVSNVADFLSSAEFLTFQKVNLPHLSRLLIAAPLSTVITLLSYMDFPLETELRLECRESPGVSVPLWDILSSDEGTPPSHSLDGYTTLSSLLGQRFNTSTDLALSGTVIRSLVVYCCEYNKTRLAFSASKRDYNSFYSTSGEWGLNTPLRILVHFGESTDVDDQVRITSDIYCSIPLTHVQSIHVIKPPSSHDFWKKTMMHLPNLRYIKLSNGTMPDLTSILSVSNLSASEGMGSRDGDIECGSDGLVPALKELELDGICFSRARDVGARGATDAQSLYDALSTRKNTQGRLVLTRCQFIGKEDSQFDLVGRWGDGRFRVVEKRTSRTS